MRAGLLDRAETLFNDLVAMDALAPPALNHLIAICQHERDWAKAIEHARKLERIGGEPQGAVIAHSIARSPNRHVAQRPRRCARGGRCGIRGASGRRDARPSSSATSSRSRAGWTRRSRFERVAARDVDYVPEVLSPLLDCYARAGDAARRGVPSRGERAPYGCPPVPALAGLYARTKGEQSGGRVPHSAIAPASFGAP